MRSRANEVRTSDFIYCSILCKTYTKKVDLKPELILIPLHY